MTKNQLRLLLSGMVPLLVISLWVRAGCHQIQPAHVGKGRMPSEPTSTLMPGEGRMLSVSSEHISMIIATQCVLRFRGSDSIFPSQSLSLTHSALDMTSRPAAMKSLPSSHSVVVASSSWDWYVSTQVCVTRMSFSQMDLREGI